MKDIRTEWVKIRTEAIMANGGTDEESARAQAAEDWYRAFGRKLVLGNPRGVKVRIVVKRDGRRRAVIPVPLYAGRR